MPWTATFQADFQQFDEALEASNPKLFAFQQNTKQVSRELQKLTSEFDGTKVIQQAQTMATAVEKIGGVAKLTETEQRKLNATVQESLAKFKALGTEAPASVSKLANELRTVQGMGGGLTKMFGDVKTAALGAFAGFSAANLATGAIAGLQQMAGQAIELAGTITDLANQAGVSASALLRMSNAAELSGVGADSLATQITRLTDTLMSGNKSAVSAVRALNLSMDDLLAMSSDERYTTIIDALSRVGDEALQTKLAYDIFGRGAADALKLVRDEFVETQRAAVTWSDEQIRILAELGDKWDQFKQGVVSSIGVVMTQVSTLGAYLQDFAEANYAAMALLTGQGLGLLFSDRPKAPISPLAGRIGEAGIGMPSDAELQAIIRDLDDQAGATRKAAEKAAKLNATLLDQRGWDAHVAALHRASEAYRQLATMSAAAAQGLASADRARAATYQMFAQAQLPGWTSDVPEGIGTEVWTPGVSVGLFSPKDKTTPRVAGFSDLYGWNSMKGALPGQIASVFTGGGNIGGGLGSIAGGLGGKALGGMASALAGSGFLSTGLASAMGLAGNVLPVLGPLVGGMLGKYIGGLFGPSKSAIADKEATGRIGTTQQSLISQYGSLDTIASMNTAGAELAAGWGHQGRAGEAAFKQQVADFVAMTEKQNTLLGEQATKQREIADIEAKRASLAESLVVQYSDVQRIQREYGIEAAQLGGALAQKGTTESASKIINDLDTLKRAAEQAGGSLDWGGTLKGMSEELSALAQESMKLGTALPANMRPFYEELLRNGQLVDENGEKLKDLSGIKFGDAIKTQAEQTQEEMDSLKETFNTLTDSLNEIVRQLKEMMPAAAREGATAVEREMASRRPRLTVDVGYNDPGYESTGYDGERHAASTFGFRDFGAGRLAVLHGMEGVFQPRQINQIIAAAAGAGRSGAIVVDRPIMLDRREIGRVMFDILPDQLLAGGVSY